MKYTPLAKIIRLSAYQSLPSDHLKYQKHISEGPHINLCPFSNLVSNTICMLFLYHVIKHALMEIAKVQVKE